MAQDESERKVRLQEVIARALEAYSRRLPVAIPAKVTSYYPDKRAADCKILVMRPFIDEEDARQVESLPVVPHCPVAFPIGWSAPISDGTLTVNNASIPATTGMLITCDRSIDKWLTGNGGDVDPEFDHTHAQADAFFVPGVFAFGAVPFSTPQSYLFAGFTPGNGDFVALAQKVLNDFNDLKTHFTAVENVITGAIIDEPGNGAPSALQTALKGAIVGSPYPTPGSVAAKVLKAE